MSTTIDAKKIAATKDRHTEQGRRLRLLVGDWTEDAKSELAKHLDPKRQDAWGPPNTSLNFFQSVVGQIALQTDQTPVAKNDMAMDAQAEVVSGWGLFNRHNRHTQLVIGLRESFIRVGWNAEKNEPTVRLVPPTKVMAWATKEQPDKLVRLDERVRYKDPTTEKWGDYWDVYDLTDPANPSFRVEREEGARRIEVSKRLGVETTWPWVWGDQAFLPWVLYHAEEHGGLFAPYDWRVLVDGGYMLCLLWTFWMHAVKDASWLQKYIVDLDLGGKKTAQGTASISTDPSSVLRFVSKGNGGQVGAFPIALDPETLARAIVIYMGVLAEAVGIHSSDAQITSPQSGVALQIRQDAVRRLQKSMLPALREGDRELLAVATRTYNIFSAPGSVLVPTDDWDVAYPSVPLSHEEIEALLKHAKPLMDMGLKSPVDLLIELDPTVESREEAIAKLIQIQEDLKLLKGSSPTPSPAPAQPDTEPEEGEEEDEAEDDTTE